MTNPKRPADSPAKSEQFDAIAAADEFAASLEAEDPPPATGNPGAASNESFESILEKEVVELNTLVDKQAARIVELEDEIEKSRSRIEKQAEVEAQQKVRKILREFLEVIDDLDRALGAARDGGHPEAVIEGVELVKKSFLATLRKFNVTHRPSLGQTFDPACHDAVSMVSVESPSQNNLVIGVVQEGYAIGDDTLRPARVAVGKIG